jgi:hypothetical protein
MKLEERMFLTERDLEAIGFLSARTLRNLRSMGKGLPFYKIRGKVCYLKNDAVAYIKSKRVDPADKPRMN